MKQNDSQQINREPDITFTWLATALAGDYKSIYLINTDNDSYTEYTSEGADNALSVRSSGSDFYGDTFANSKKIIYPADQEMVRQYFCKESLLQALAAHKSSSLTYRLMVDGVPRYHFLKVMCAFEQNAKFIVLGIRDIDEDMRRQQEAQKQAQTYSEIAESLASLYEVIYFIDPETDEYIEYSASQYFSSLGLQRNGSNFFDRMTEVTKIIVHPEDYDMLTAAISKEPLLRQLNENHVYSITYRQLLDGRYQYVSLIAVVQQIEKPHIVIAVRNIDIQKRREFEAERKNASYEEIIRSLSKLYEVIYYVDITTDEYREYCASKKYAQLEVGTTGTDFFNDAQRNMKRDIFHEDLPMMSAAMEKEQFISSLNETGTTTLNYRLILDGIPQYVSLFAIRPKEDSTHIIVAVTNVDAAKRRELAFKDALGNAMNMANRDALTGVKNKNAYIQTERDLDLLISADNNPPFAVVVCDINGLKKVNDTQGHKAGDAFIKSACVLICDAFKHSPVFRIGGDEFVVLLKGQDYDNRAALMNMLTDAIQDNKQHKLVTIATGLADFEFGSDASLQQVFDRADAAMYINKKTFKRGLLG